MHGRFDIVRRAAVASALAVAPLVHLGQGAFDKGAGSADKGQQPHPEYRARAAQADGRRHADDVARTDAGGRRNHEGLKGGNSPLFYRLFHDNAHAFAEHADLNEARLSRKNQAGYAEDDDQHGIVHKII